MKKTTSHPNYRPVIFKDVSTSVSYLVFSSVETTKKEKWSDGKEYDLCEVEVTSSSHPFYTGQNTNLDRAGRAEKFNARLKKSKTLKSN